jgi:hypothetical protein
MQAHGGFQTDYLTSTWSNPVDYGGKYFFGNYGFGVIIARSITLFSSKTDSKILRVAFSLVPAGSS